MNKAWWLALLFSSISLAHAVDKPCVIGEAGTGQIITNMTHNQGCEDNEYTKVCAKFFECIRNYNICVISNNEVVKGNTENDITIKSESITFGIIQTYLMNDKPYCVMAGSADTPGMDPWWYYRIILPRTYNEPSVVDNSSANKTSKKFFEKTLEAFRKFVNVQKSSEGAGR